MVTTPRAHLGMKAEKGSVLYEYGCHCIVGLEEGSATGRGQRGGLASGWCYHSAVASWVWGLGRW